MLPRSELRMAYVDLLDRWSDVLTAAGREAECVEVGRLLLRQDPCREDVHRLMRCHGRFGRTSPPATVGVVMPSGLEIGEALRQYERCRRALCETPGLEPARPRRHSPAHCGSACRFCRPPS
jgi:hypothetical protein